MKANRLILKYLIVIVVILFATQSTFAQLSESQKVSLKSKVEKKISEYKHYAGLTPNFQISEGTDAGLEKKFLGLFVDNAQIFNDLSNDSTDKKLLSPADYTAFLKSKYTIGVAVKNITLNYYSIRPNPNAAELATTPSVLRANITKTWYGYFADSIYTEKTVNLNITFQLSEAYDVSKILKIEKNEPKKVESNPNPNQAKIDKLTAKASKLQSKIDSLQKQLDGINSEISKLEIKPEDEKSLKAEYERTLKPQK